jgi:hypothetical protein
VRARDARIRQLEKGAPAAAPAPVVDRAAIAREIATAVEKALVAERRETKRRIGLALGDVRSIAKWIGTGHSELVALGAALETMVDTTGDSRAEVQVGHTSRDAAATTGAIHPPVTAVGRSSRAPARPIATPAAAGDGSVAPGEQRILDAIAELNAFGIAEPLRVQVGIVAQYDLTGGVGSRHVSGLRERGLLTTPTGGALTLTAEGARQARHPERALTLAEFHGRVLARLDDGERRILEYLMSVYPRAESRDVVGAHARYDLTGGVGSRHVRKLVALRFIDIPSKRQLRAGKLLYPEALS